MKNKRRAKCQCRVKRMQNRHVEKELWRRTNQAHSLLFPGPKRCNLSWLNQGFGASSFATTLYKSIFISNIYE
ncbi:hypothetical protein RND71_032062 [Anisodus tanguticus]|uniref:Uncharacterized protein n=1 Tax=Anisodus tanguticus TaxID=243964 RepID=A0AAE1REP8_9SOLA|nr:hypothetical protein RND71_032062 [Anisodus tanguticus]